MEEINFIVGFTFCSLLLLLGIVLFLGIAADRFHKELEELKDKQFDAHQVMALYQHKFARPIIYEDRADVIELHQDFSVPWDIYKQLDEKEFDDFISKKLCEEYADAIKPFIEYRADNDYATNCRVVHSRIRIVGHK